MILRTCPYTTNAEFNPSTASPLGKINIVALHTTKNDVTPTHTAPLSVKCVLSGSEKYKCEDDALSVDSFKYLIINKGQPYSSAINSEGLTSSFCVFFSDMFVSDGLRIVNESSESLLDNPSNNTTDKLEFYQKLYWKDDTMNWLLTSAPIAPAAGLPHDDLTIDEWCAQLLEVLITTHGNEKSRWLGLKAAKVSTKLELYRRLSKSVDFIHEYYSSLISLTQLSHISCLSSFHFLRTFTQAFRVTPHHYITLLRLKHACQLLKQTEAPVYDVCNACGFQDESSFIRLFKTYYKLTPARFRKKNHRTDHTLNTA